MPFIQSIHHHQGIDELSSHRQIDIRNGSDVHCHRRKSSAGRFMPCISKYLSRASSSLQFSNSSQVVLPRLHLTSNLMFFLFQQCPSSSSTNHLCSSGTPKSYGSGCTLLGNSESLDVWYALRSETWNTGLILHSWRAVGNSNSYVDVEGHAHLTLYSPTNLEHSFLARPLGKFRFFVER